MKTIPCLFAVLASLALGSCQDTSTPIGNLCDSSIEDYETLKPKVEALFPVGMTAKEARAMLSRIGVKEIKHLPIYEKKNDRFVYKNGRPVLLKSEIVGGTISCPIADQNMNWWQIETYVDETGRVGEAGFNVFIKDENFGKRDIQLKASYIAGDSILRKAVRSLFQTRFSDWYHLKKHLVDGEFKVYKSKQRKYPTIQKYIVKKIQDYKLLSIRKTWQRLPGKIESSVAGVHVDPSGKVIRVPEPR